MTTRAVLDANVLIAAPIKPTGRAAECLKAHADGRFELVASPRLLAELRTVLERTRFRRYLTAAEAAAYVNACARSAVMVDDPPDPARLSADADDDYLVALAVAADAHVLVTRDAHLLDIAHPPLRVASPREFLALLPP